MTKKTALIVGIGIAGPTLAYWLLRQGFQVTLVEQANGLRSSGYVIDFWGIGFDIAERMGLVPDLKRIGYDVTDLRLVNARGRQIGGFKVDVFRQATNGRYVSIARSDLAAIIFRKIEDRCETIFGDTVVEIVPQVDKVDVKFRRTPQRQFDIVIGAGGLHSAVRRLAFGKDAEYESYLGYMVAAFEKVGYVPREPNAYVSYSVPGKQVARFAMRDDRTMFLLVFADELGLRGEPHDIETHKRILNAQFSHIGWECPQILSAMGSCKEIYFDRVSQIRLGTWSKGRVGLVGDAAFAPSLLAGQGAALAMIGAYVLAGELGKPDVDVAQAFKRYESSLHPFMLEKQEAAARFAGAFAPKTTLGLFLRNQMTKLFALPLVADWAMGATLADHITLPNYEFAAPS